MTCPYCGGEMRHGKFIFDGRTKCGWLEDTKRYSKTELFFGLYKTLSCIVRRSPNYWMASMDGDFCPKCKKMIFDTEILET